MKNKAILTGVLLLLFSLGIYFVRWFHAAESDTKESIGYRQAEYLAEFCRTGDQATLDNFKKEVCSDSDGLYCKMELSQIFDQSISKNRDNPEKLKIICRVVLRNGGLPNRDWMQYAIENKYSIEIVDFLIKEGKVRYKDDVGSQHDSALIYAIRRKNVEAALYFIREFPELRKKSGTGGKTPLELARKQGLVAVEKALKQPV